MQLLKPNFTFTLKYLCLLAASCFTTTLGHAQVIKPTEIDKLVENTLQTFNVPGIAIAIVKDDKIVYAQGYGVRSVNTKQKVDENTLFGIASNSKAFTTAAIGILVDEGKLKLEDKVTDYIPEFKLYDPWVTAEFTIRDLLTHRSGLGLGAGDLMDFPDSTDFTLKDVIHNLRYFKPVSSFRSKFDYDNQLYKVAGEVIARVSGISWEEFIETRIMQPLQMSHSSASYQRLKDRSNIIDAHMPINGHVVVIPRYTSLTGNAAGGIYSSVTDLSKWAMMQMNNGSYGDGLNKHLLSTGIHQQMWTAQTILPIDEINEISPYNTHFAAYGLGWFLNDERGYKVVSHTGGIDGMVTKVTLVPELKLGIIVLTNQQSGAAFEAITNQVKDAYFGVKGKDWVKIFSNVAKGYEENANKAADAIWKQVEAHKTDGSKADAALYTGTYHDNWLGDAVISEKNGQLWFTAKRSPKLNGPLLPYKANTFVIKWASGRGYDAFATFITDEDGKATAIKTKPITPDVDFSYDFQDLDLQKVK
jgi:CubicO group peptidase (beta-lactamase class C family)